MRTQENGDDQPVILTSDDEIPVQKYNSHVIDEDESFLLTE